MNKQVFRDSTSGKPDELTTYGVDRRDSGCQSDSDESRRRAKIDALGPESSGTRPYAGTSTSDQPNVKKTSNGKGTSVPNSNGPATGYAFGTTQPQVVRPRGGKGVSVPNASTPPGADNAFSRGTGKRSAGKGTSAPNTNGPTGSF